MLFYFISWENESQFPSKELSEVLNNGVWALVWPTHSLWLLFLLLLFTTCVFVYIFSLLPSFPFSVFLLLLTGSSISLPVSFPFPPPVMRQFSRENYQYFFAQCKESLILAIWEKENEETFSWSIYGCINIDRVKEHFNGNHATYDQVFLSVNFILNEHSFKPITSRFHADLNIPICDLSLKSCLPVWCLLFWCPEEQT